jgi:RimJ/RimL family protein N-acetyltransferase
MAAAASVQPTLTGKYAQLRPLELSDAPALFKVSTPEVWAYMRTGVNTEEEMRQWVADAVAGREKNDDLPFAIVDVRNNEVVGSTRVFDIHPGDRNGEIGHTWISPKMWRTQINTECKLMLLGYCFEQLGYIRVQLKTDLRNKRSQKAIERLGATKEGALRDHLILPGSGYRRTSVYYSILDNEWPEVKKRLQGYLGY